MSPPPSRRVCHCTEPGAAGAGVFVQDRVNTVDLPGMAGGRG
jgi:hypothetical protein